MEQALWFLTGLGLGLLLDWVLVKVMLHSVKEKVKLYRDWETDRKSTRLNSSHRL